MTVPVRITRLPHGADLPLPAYETAGARIGAPAGWSTAELVLKVATPTTEEVARLKPGVTPEQGRQDLLRIQAALGEEFPATDLGWTAIVSDLRESRVGTRRSALLMVFGAVALTWMVGLANIAGLVIVHTQRRARELGRAGIAGQAEHRATAVRPPVRRAQPGEGRHDDHATGVGHALGQGLHLAAGIDHRHARFPGGALADGT